jgi:D-aminoacyl-tRNA deacylase
VRLVIQRVKNASVTVDGAIVGQINKGLLVFLGVAKGDTPQSADDLVKKLFELRIFEDSDGKMNLSASEANAQFLIVSQFTLLGNCDKGRRPSFDDAADPVSGEQLYKYFVEQLKKSNMTVETGRFRAMMDVSLVNDGPVTFVVDSK